MEIKVSEFVETKDGGYFKHYTEHREFPDSEGRHCNICIFCGFPSYPKCMEWCPNGRSNESEN